MTLDDVMKVVGLKAERMVHLTPMQQAAESNMRATIARREVLDSCDLVGQRECKTEGCVSDHFLEDAMVAGRRLPYYQAAQAIALLAEKDGKLTESLHSVKWRVRDMLADRSNPDGATCYDLSDVWRRGVIGDSAVPGVIAALDAERCGGIQLMQEAADLVLLILDNDAEVCRAA